MTLIEVVIFTAVLLLCPVAGDGTCDKSYSRYEFTDVVKCEEYTDALMPMLKSVAARRGQYIVSFDCVGTSKEAEG